MAEGGFPPAGGSRAEPYAVHLPGGVLSTWGSETLFLSPYECIPYTLRIVFITPLKTYSLAPYDSIH